MVAGEGRCEAWESGLRREGGEGACGEPRWERRGAGDRCGRVARGLASSIFCFCCWHTVGLWFRPFVLRHWCALYTHTPLGRVCTYAA